MTAKHSSMLVETRERLGLGGCEVLLWVEALPGMWAPHVLVAPDAAGLCSGDLAGPGLALYQQPSAYPFIDGGGGGHRAGPGKLTRQALGRTLAGKH